jgi:hypothetical protein
MKWTNNTEQQGKRFGGESSKSLLILGRWARIWQLKLLIGSTFKDLGLAPISTLYTAFGVERLRATIWQTLNLKRLKQSASRHCINLLAVHQKGEAVQRGKFADEISSQVLPLPTFFVSFPSRDLHCTHVCFSFQKVVFRSMKCF